MRLDDNKKEANNSKVMASVSSISMIDASEYERNTNKYKLYQSSDRQSFRKDIEPVLGGLMGRADRKSKNIKEKKIANPSSPFLSNTPLSRLTPLVTENKANESGELKSPNDTDYGIDFLEKTNKPHANWDDNPFRQADESNSVADCTLNTYKQFQGR